MSAEKPVATEVAEAEFARWADSMGLAAKLDPSVMDDADKKSLAAAKLSIVQAIEGGRLVVDDKGQFIFTPSDGTGAITFYEPTGASFIAMDAKKDGHNNAKMITAIADFTKTPAARFSGMKLRDLTVCLAIAGLFLG